MNNVNQFTSVAELLADVEVGESVEVDGVCIVKTDPAERAALKKARVEGEMLIKFPSHRDGKPTNTIGNLKAIFDHYGIKARVNEITKKMDVTIPVSAGKALGMDTSGAKNLSAKLALIKSLAVENNMAATETKTYTCALGDMNSYNPIREMIDSKPWDGKSRLKELYETIQVREGFSRKTLETFMKRWLIAAVAAAYKESGFWHKGVLTFQGAQSLGKTKWVNSLVPKGYDEYIRSGILLNVNSKDSVLEATGAWITELGELDATFSKSQIEDLKAFITRKVDVIRRPYAPEDEAFPRRTVFFASVNGVSFLNDDTGNDRWWPVPVAKIDSEHGINMQQLWAEVFTLYDNGEQWWLTDEEQEIQRNIAKDFESANPVEEKIMSYFNWSLNDHAMALTATQVMEKIGYANPTPKQVTACGTLLRRLCKVDKPRKSNGKFVFDMPTPYAEGGF